MDERIIGLSLQEQITSKPNLIIVLNSGVYITFSYCLIHTRIVDQ